MQTPDTPLDMPPDNDLDVRMDVPLDNLDTEVDAGLDSVLASTLSAVEAARVAGVHGRTIRRAITEGRLAATMEDGAYRLTPAALVAWRATRTPKPTLDTAPDAVLDTTSDIGVDVQPRVQDTVQPPAPGTADVIAAKDALVERLADEVAYLRVQLDQRGRELEQRAQELEQRSRELAAERERADVIQQLALQRIEALTATIGEQRESAPERAPDAPGSTEGAPEHPSSWWATMLRKVRGS